MYKAHKYGMQFELSNDLCRAHGFGKNAKVRSLARYEKAGRLRVIRRPRRSLIVTLLEEKEST